MARAVGDDDGGAGEGQPGRLVGDHAGEHGGRQLQVLDVGRAGNQALGLDVAAVAGGAARDRGVAGVQRGRGSAGEDIATVDVGGGGVDVARTVGDDDGGAGEGQPARLVGDHAGEHGGRQLQVLDVGRAGNQALGLDVAAVAGGAAHDRGVAGVQRGRGSAGEDIAAVDVGGGGVDVARTVGDDDGGAGEGQPARLVGDHAGEHRGRQLQVLDVGRAGNQALGLDVAAVAGGTAHDRRVPAASGAAGVPVKT